MKNLKISTRLMGLVTALCMLVLLVGGLGLFGQEKSSSGLRSV